MSGNFNIVETLNANHFGSTHLLLACIAQSENVEEFLDRVASLNPMPSIATITLDKDKIPNLEETDKTKFLDALVCFKVSAMRMTKSPDQDGIKKL